jgi:hypothetical protein
MHDESIPTPGGARPREAQSLRSAGRSARRSVGGRDDGPGDRAPKTKQSPEPTRSSPAEGPVDLSWEPRAGNPLAGFCPGGGPKGPSLPGRDGDLNVTFDAGGLLVSAHPRLHTLGPLQPAVKGDDQVQVAVAVKVNVAVKVKVNVLSQALRIARDDGGSPRATATRCASCWSPTVVDRSALRLQVVPRCHRPKRVALPGGPSRSLTEARTGRGWCPTTPLRNALRLPTVIHRHRPKRASVAGGLPPSRAEARYGLLQSPTTLIRRAVRLPVVSHRAPPQARCGHDGVPLATTEATRIGRWWSPPDPANSLQQSIV